MGRTTDPRPSSMHDSASVAAIDAVVGISTVALRAAMAAARRSRVVVDPVAGAVLHPPLLPVRTHPGFWLAAVSRQGQEQRAVALRRLSTLLDALVPAAVAAVVRRLDLTALVKEYVDLDALVRTVDLDAAAERLDVDAVARGLDLDAVLDRLDLTGLVRDRVDLDTLAAGVDLDAVARRLDVDAVVRRVDIDAVVDRIDLVGLAEQVIEAIDLPEIIRESTGTVASDAVRGVRMQGIAGDEALARVMARLLGRREPDAQPGRP